MAIALAVGAVGCNHSPPDDPADSPGKSPAAPPWFEDVTDAVGLNFKHDCGPTGTFFMPQSMYGGVALFDADGDGRLDILLLQGAGPNTGVGNRLYLQTPDGKFRDASAGSGLDFDGWNVGVAIGDVDNDGRPDVLITQYCGSGCCSTRAAASSGTSRPRPASPTRTGGRRPRSSISTATAGST